MVTDELVVKDRGVQSVKTASHMVRFYQCVKFICDQGWTDIDFLPDTGFGYPTPKIRPDLDLARSDFSCNRNTVGP